MSVFSYSDQIDEIMAPVKRALGDILYYKQKTDLNKNVQTGYVLFYIDSEEIIPPSLKEFTEDGYDSDGYLTTLVHELCYYRNCKIKCHIKYSTYEECAAVLNAIIASNWVNANQSNGVSYPDNRETNKQGFTIVYNFELNLPVSRRANQIIELKTVYFTPEFGVPENDETIYNPNLDVPPKFDLIP